MSQVSGQIKKKKRKFSFIILENLIINGRDYNEEIYI